jgi:hypothetical protein
VHAHGAAELPPAHRAGEVVARVDGDEELAVLDRVGELLVPVATGPEAVGPDVQEDAGRASLAVPGHQRGIELGADPQFVAARVADEDVPLAPGRGGGHRGVLRARVRCTTTRTQRAYDEA